MYSFSSASQMCDPFPRTINGGSPPTEPKARTGEFTPPGIMLSARCCKRRDCSTFRDVVDGIACSRSRLSSRASVLCAARDLGEPRDASRTLRRNNRAFGSLPYRFYDHPKNLLDNFLLDYHFQMRRHVFMQLDWDRKLAQSPQRLVQLDLAAIHVEALFIERVPDVTGRDRTEQLIVFPGTALERNRETIKLLGQLFRLRLFLGRTAH